MILDTCALLWLTQGAAALSTEAQRQIQASPLVYVSAISAFEVGIKWRKGKLTLPVAAPEWFRAVVLHHHLTVVDVSADIFLKATGLPPIHDDPCDRVIIATALLHDWPIVTADTVFAPYGVRVVP